jgi:hypothetical protein
VLYDDELPRVEQVVGDQQTADGVLGGQPAGIADDVGLAGLQTQQVLDGETGIHATEDRDLLRRLDGLRTGMARDMHSLPLGVSMVVAEQGVGV